MLIAHSNANFVVLCEQSSPIGVTRADQAIHVVTRTTTVIALILHAKGRENKSKSYHLKILATPLHVISTAR